MDKFYGKQALLLCIDAPRGLKVSLLQMSKPSRAEVLQELGVLRLRNALKYKESVVPSSILMRPKNCLDRNRYHYGTWFHFESAVRKVSQRSSPYRAFVWCGQP